MIGPIRVRVRRDLARRERWSGTLSVCFSGDGMEQGTGEARHPTVVPAHFHGAVPNTYDDAGARSLPDLLRALFYVLALP